MACQVGSGLKPFETLLGQYSPNRPGLIAAVLEGEQSARAQALRGLMGKTANGVEAVRSRCQGGARLEGEVASGEVGITVADVGWVAYDGVQGTASDWLQPVGLDQAGIVQPITQQVVRSHAQSARVTLSTQRGCSKIEQPLSFSHP